MGKNQSASNLTNIIKQDGSGNIVFTSGSTTLATISTTGQLSGSTAVKSATTASYADNFTVTGNLTAQTLVVQTITSSVDFVTGSTRFGSLSSNTHTFTGSILASGSSHNIFGNVGIGTTSLLGSATERTLHLSDSGTGYTTLYVTNAANTLRGIFAIDNGASKISIGTQTNTDLRIVTNDIVKMTITNGGNVGIGTSSPSYVLDVQYGGSLSQRIRNNAAGGTATLLLETANTFSGTSQAYVQCIGSSGGGQSQLIFATAGASGDTTATERMRITSAGVVTKPYQPAFKAGRSTSISVGSNSTVIFDDTSGNHFNIGGHYNTSTGMFTAPVDGRYVFSVCIIYQSMAAGQPMDDAFYIYRNSTLVTYSFRRAEYEAGYTGNAGYYVDHANTLLSLSAGDTVSIRNNRALDIHGNTNYCFFYGYLVG